MTLKELLEARARAWEQMKEINDRAKAGEDLSAEDEASFTRAESDYDRLDKQIQRQEKIDAGERRLEQVETDPIVNPGNTERGDERAAEYDEAFSAYVKRGLSRMPENLRTALEQGVSNDPEIRALSVGTNTAGGYLVPPGWRNEFIVQLKDYGAVQEVAQVIETESGQSIQWPTMNDTTNVGRLLAENTQMTETDVVVGTKTLDAYVYSSDLTRVSLQLANDSGFDVGNLVRSAHAERIGRITNQHFTTGTGTAQPDGIVTGATSGVTAASTTAITADELIDLVHSVDPAYRRSPRAQFMLSDTALKSVRKLKDSNGMYLWQPNVQAGTASTLFGYGYVINQDMAVPAAGVKSVLFGDFFAGYVIRIVQGIQVITFTERYMDYLQLGHSSFMRADGTVQNASAYKALTQAAV